jgi:hypothetical protein
VSRLKDFVTFCGYQVRYSDHDPHAVLYSSIADYLHLSQEKRLWLGLLLMAYYQEGSAWAAFRIPKVRERKSLPPDLPISLQRRNLFGGRINQHLEWIMKKNSLIEWLDVKHWQKLLDRLDEAYGNGHWSTYTTAELLIRMGGISHKIMPNTFDIPGAPGPVQGMRSLHMEPNERNATLLRDYLKKKGVDAPVEVVESLLCNWNALYKGIYYSGANIDRQQVRILEVEKKLGQTFPELWYVRKHSFNRKVLGELNGWNDVPKDRKRVYKKTGKVLKPYEDRE